MLLNFIKNWVYDRFSGYPDWLVEVGVPKNEIDKCMTWALGDNYGSMPCNQGDEMWNARHADLFILRGDDNVRESVKKIGRAYLQMVANKKED